MMQVPSQSVWATCISIAAVALLAALLFLGPCCSLFSHARHCMDREYMSSGPPGDAARRTVAARAEVHVFHSGTRTPGHLVNAYVKALSAARGPISDCGTQLQVVVHDVDDESADGAEKLRSFGVTEAGGGGDAMVAPMVFAVLMAHESSAGAATLRFIGGPDTCRGLLSWMSTMFPCAALAQCTGDDFAFESLGMPSHRPVSSERVEPADADRDLPLVVDGGQGDRSGFTMEPYHNSSAVQGDADDLVVIRDRRGSYLTVVPDGKVRWVERPITFPAMAVSHTWISKTEEGAGGMTLASGSMDGEYLMASQGIAGKGATLRLADPRSFPPQKRPFFCWKT
jgi:hypothetical protein